MFCSPRKGGSRSTTQHFPAQHQSRDLPQDSLCPTQEEYPRLPVSKRQRPVLLASLAVYRSSVLLFICEIK